MKTIEERGNDYAKENTHSGLAFRVAKMSYIAGATEQREIDIQRAVEWLSSRLSFPAIDRDMLVASFKQAMKGGNL